MANSSLHIESQTEQGFAVHPKKFIVWILMASIFMMFGALSSAYIVRKGEGNWLQFELPSVFTISTVLIILSSLTYHMAYIASKKDELPKMKVLLMTTTLLGVGFLISQYYSWVQLYNYKFLNGYGVVFGGEYSNPAGSFLYVLSGLHGFHIITGLGFLIAILVLAFKNKIHSKSQLWIETCGNYWHFLGILWIYLYIFIIFNH